MMTVHSFDYDHHAAENIFAALQLFKYSMKANVQRRRRRQDNAHIYNILRWVLRQSYKPRALYYILKTSAEQFRFCYWGNTTQIQLILNYIKKIIFIISPQLLHYVGRILIRTRICIRFLTSNLTFKPNKIKNFPNAAARPIR